jgi:hypothetical protein
MAASSENLPSRRRPPMSNTVSTKARVVVYWISTLLVAQEMVAATLWAFLRPDYAGSNLAHLGYPPYVQSIIGIWAFPCAVALVVPGFGQVKEWAYAGAFFDYSGAVASHVIVGDGPSKWAAALVFSVLTLASRALLPEQRRRRRAPGETARARPWLVSVFVIAMLIAVGLLTLPGKNQRLAARPGHEPRAELHLNGREPAL